MKNSFQKLSRRKDGNKDEKYLPFLLRLGEQCFQHLFEGANISQRSICLNCLSILFANFCDVLGGLKTLDNHNVLIRNLEDSFAEHQELSLNILQYFGPLKNVDNLWSRCQRLLLSHRPNDSIYGTSLLKAIVQNNLRDLAKLMPGQSEADIRKSVMFRLSESLQDQVNVAKDDLCKASEEGPMYGTCQAIRILLFEIFSHKEHLFLKEWTENILNICLEALEAVKEVVNNDSPEGHLPMDLQTKEGKDRTVYSQMLLLCAWRTTREVCLLIGVICQVQILPKARVMKIAELFTRMLAEIKHRGAFEKTYTGYCYLLLSLWRSEDSDLDHIPKTILSDSISQLEKSSSTLCATRRSAGFPFVIQGVLATDPSPDKQLLKSTVDSLFKFAESKDSDLKIHACNILRVLFRDSLLGDFMGPLADQGFKVAIMGFKSDSWSVSLQFRYSDSFDIFYDVDVIPCSR